MRSGFLVALALLGLASQAVPATPPNIVLITADDLYSVSLGCNGSTVKDMSPHLPQLPRLPGEGCLLPEANAIITACQPARATMPTGLYPTRSGCMCLLSPAQ